MKTITTLALLAAALVPGCFVVVDAEDRQCSTDGDCTALGPAFAGTFCNAQKVCQNNLSYCATNAQCIDRTGDNTYMCRKSDNTCIKLITNECPKLLAEPDDLRNDDAFIIGHLGLPTTAPPLQSAEDGLEMARREFRDVTKGVPNQSTPRPVVVIACDAKLQVPDSYQLATDHMVDTVGVPVVFGPQPPAWGPYLFQKASAKGTILMTFGYNVELDPSLNRKGVLFRNGYDRADIPLVANALISTAIEAQVRAERAIPPEQPLKVAMMYTDVGLQGSNVATIIDKLQFNGKAALANGENFKQFSYASIDDPDYQAKFAASIIAATDYKADIVMVPLGGNEVADVVAQFEGRLPNHAHFITSSAAATPKTFAAVTASPSLHKRLWMTQSLQSQTDRNFALFQQQYKSVFPDRPAPPEIFATAAASYDLFYFLMYAAAAVSPGELTGANLGQALLNRTRGGTEIEMGPGSIVAAVQRLSLGENILYRGSATTSGFDDLGDIGPPIQILCATGQAAPPVSVTGLYYDKMTKTMKGMNTCF